MITDPLAIRFTNEQARPMADRLAKTYYAAKQFVNNWNSQNMAAVLPPGGVEVVDDGSVTDGRNPVTSDEVYAIVLRAQEFIVSLEADNQAKLVSVLTVAVNVNP